MKAVIMCGFAKIKRRKIPSLLLGICITITAALLVNALVFVRESEAIFDRAYEEMEGPQMCCLWNKEVVSCSDVKEYMDAEGNRYRKEIFLGQTVPGYLIHEDLRRIRDCLDLLFSEIMDPSAILDQFGEFSYDGKSNYEKMREQYLQVTD